MKTRLDNTAAPNTSVHPINLPNLITGLRILLIPVFLFLFLTPTPTRALWAAIVFVLASTTDLLDGYIARKMEQVTSLGKLLDPIADKLLVLSALVLLVQFQRVPAFLAILLIGREMTITGLRLIAANQGLIIPAERLGKFKTFIQVVSITLLILDESHSPAIVGMDIHDWGRVLLWISVILAYLSAVQYFQKFIHQIRQRH